MSIKKIACALIAVLMILAVLPVASMASASDVVRTALNMQLNGGEDVGALCFENKTGSEKETLLGRDVWLKFLKKFATPRDFL